MLRLLLLLLFALGGLQAPQMVRNYEIGASAVVQELQGDYDRLRLIAEESHLTVPQLLSAAGDAQNIYAQKIVHFVAEKIPRYLHIKAQLHTLKQGEVFSSLKIVFFQHDAAIWNNVLHTYRPGLYLNFDPAWYLLIFTFALAMMLSLQGLWWLGRRSLRLA